MKESAGIPHRIPLNHLLHKYNDVPTSFSAFLFNCSIEENDINLNNHVFDKKIPYLTTRNGCFDLNLLDSHAYHNTIKAMGHVPDRRDLTTSSIYSHYRQASGVNNMTLRGTSPFFIRKECQRPLCVHARCIIT